MRARRPWTPPEENHSPVFHKRPQPFFLVGDISTARTTGFSETSFLGRMGSTYHRHPQRQADPARRSARAHRDDTLRLAIQRVYDEHHQVYGPRKVWKQLRREGIRARAAPSSA